ncbi:class I SAM-dependent methyltransferase [Sphingobium yanoikuyae]|uniref:class I SAM-dependent methyltransferase n=1 Tax=Sphingobium yanoikuyae TaxID=13690 RepID=UPI00345ECB51
MSILGPDDLPNFVSTIDSLGGPGDPRVDEYWRGVVYQPKVRVDTRLDPFSREYYDAQIALYKEMSGRELDQSINEHTIFDKASHVRARNPYNHGDPGMLATQIVQLATAMRLARPKRGARLVDMGCGWGLSSELGAYLGLDVEAVDINRDFVSLVHDRSLRYGYDINAVHASFDSYQPSVPVDMFLFYECLHHAVEPWTLIERLASMLNPGGKVVACGEPINTHWWPHWGLRLDPMSVYCIHKHGWFESGWSQDFLVKCFERAHFNVEITDFPDPIGQFVVASKDEALGAKWLSRHAVIEGGELDGDYIVANASTSLIFNEPVGSGGAALLIQNFRPKDIQAKLRLGGGKAQDLTIPPGETRLPIERVEAGTALHFESETWRPSDEIGNLDYRNLAFHISGLIPEHSPA